MSRVFVDTLANLALLVATDAAHPAANRAFARLAACEAALLTTSCVLVETYSARICLVESPLGTTPRDSNARIARCHSHRAGRANADLPGKRAARAGTGL